MTLKVVKEPKKFTYKYTSISEEPNNIPISEDEFHHALTTTIETSPEFDRVTY